MLLAAQIGGGPAAMLPLASTSWAVAQEVGYPADRLPSLPPLNGRSDLGPLPTATQHQSTAVVNTLELPAAYVASVSTVLEMRYRDVPGVQISPDVRSSRLVILAPASLQAQIQREAMQIYATESRPGNKSVASDGGLRAADGSLQVRLASISWREFEDSLQRVAGKRLPVTTSQNGERATFQLTGATLDGTKIEVDRRENLVTVVAPEPSMPGWQKMIRSLDQTNTNSDDVIELVRVENAKPAPIQRAIRLLDQLPAGQAGALLPTAPGDAPLRNVMLQAPAAQPPTPQPPAQPPAQQPAQPAGPQEDLGSGIIGDTQIQFVPELGIIIVRGPRRDAQRVMDVIRQIEQQSAVTQPEIEVYQLKHLDGAAAAALLNQLYENVLAARQGEVSITPLDHPNALLLIGRREALASALSVIEKIDQPLDASSRLQVFRLNHASAVDAEQTVRSFFVDRPGVGEDLRPGLGTRVRILADYRTNSLIVGASPRDLQEVEGLLRQLDVEKIPAQNEIRVFPLRNSLAADLAPVLQTAINGEGDATTPENLTRPSTSLSIVSLDSQAGGVIDSGILAGVVVTSDANANAIVVRGPSSSMSLIGELIRQLDQVPGVESVVKVFTIENGDAVQLSTALQQLFSQSANQGVGQGNLAGLAPATAASSSLVNLRFSTDQRTNSIIASGSASDLEVVESILLRLDTSGFAERITEVIWLRHQSAPEIAAAIQSYVQQRVQTVNTIQQFQQGLGPFDLPDRDLVVVAEVETNSLLLSVSPRLYTDVRRLIESLDRRPPMVLIKVVIAEVLLDDLFELGGEIGLQDSLLFDRGRAVSPGSAGTPGFNFNNNGTPNTSAVDPATVASRAVSTFGLGTASQAAGFGGFVLSAASDSFSLLLRSLQNANRAQILSRPQIMTVDNKVGFINVGQQVARVNGLSQGTLGTPPILNVTDVEVGLTLEVLPRVGADGMISMQIVARRAEVDRTTGTGTPIGTDLNGVPIIVPDINETRAESTIVAYSGQTVVFGGLIQKNRANQSRRVPYLADIPLIGVMFRFDRESETRSELLIIMTPLLVNGDEDLEYVKQVESSRMSYCLADVVEMHGDVGLSGGYGLWGPAVGPTIYPDLHPTVDQFPTVIEGEGYNEKLYGPSTVIESPYPGNGPGHVEMLSPPQPVYPPQSTPAPQGATYPPGNYPPGNYPPGIYSPGTYPPGAVGPQGTPGRELPPGSVPAPSAGPGAGPAPTPGPQQLEQARRGGYPWAQPGVTPAATATPAGANPPGRFVKPADFKFIDGNAAAELSGFAK